MVRGLASILMLPILMPMVEILIGDISIGSSSVERMISRFSRFEREADLGPSQSFYRE